MHQPPIDPERFFSHRGVNRFQTLLLLGLMTGYAGLVSWLGLLMVRRPKPA